MPYLQHKLAAKQSCSHYHEKVSWDTIKYSAVLVLRGCFRLQLDDLMNFTPSLKMRLLDGPPTKEASICSLYIIFDIHQFFFGIWCQSLKNNNWCISGMVAILVYSICFDCSIMPKLIQLSTFTNFCKPANFGCQVYLAKFNFLHVRKFWCCELNWC